MALFHSCYEACTSGSIDLSPFFIVISYICIWTGFLLWCLMGTFWATINIHDVAFTYIGLYHVCDEWKGYESDSSDSVMSSHALHQTVRSDVRHSSVTPANSSEFYPTTHEDGWYKCMDTMAFIAPHNGKTTASNADVMSILPHCQRHKSTVAGFTAFSANGILRFS